MQRGFTIQSKVDGLMLDGLVVEPEEGVQRTALLQLSHGMSEYKERYLPFMEFMAEHGVVCVIHDHRGHGKSVKSEQDLGFMYGAGGAGLVEDLFLVTKWAKKEYPDLPFVLMGHSMGSYMLRKYLTIHNDDLRGAIIMGTGCVPDNTTKLGINVCKFLAKIFGWHHRSKLVESLSFGGPYKKYDLSGKTLSNSWLTKDEDIVKFYYSEPRCTFKFTLNGYLGLMEAVLYDNQLENVKKVPNKLPIFIVSGQDDPVGDNGVGVKKVYDLFKEAGSLDITYKLYENDRHEILNETDRDKVYADLLAWMRVRIDT